VTTGFSTPPTPNNMSPEHQHRIESLGLSRFPRPLSKAASAHLDLIRAVAASLVMWGHLRNLFFVDFENVQHGSRLVKAIYFLTGFGHQSVVIFFILSGFLISSTVMKRFVAGAWSWRGYAIDRLTRLYVVLIPGLLFGLLWDKAGSHFFGSSGLYTQPLAGFGPAIVQNRITLLAFFGNLAFLQTLVSPVFGSNGPLWSLANEFWYYALFPVGLAAVAAWASTRIWRAVPLTAVAISMAAFVRSPILPGFLIWLMGCALVVVYARLTLQRPGWLLPYLLISASAVLACLVASRIGGPGTLASDFTLGATFSIFLFGVLQIELREDHSGYAKVAHVFAGFSYSLYVLHFPMLLFLRAWLTPSHRWQPDISRLFYALAIGTVALLFAWLVSVFTEAKTAGVRSQVDTVIPHFAEGRRGQPTSYATEQVAPSKT
jgi:peptidoglycan/LPS O-acetylase OafA/YrhL